MSLVNSGLGVPIFRGQTALTEWAVWVETEVDKTTRIMVAGDKG